MIDHWIWGEVPAGYTKVCQEHAQMMIIRRGLERTLTVENFLSQADRKDTTSPFQGREALRFFHLENGESALVRAYKHGGLFRWFTGNFFFTWPPRPFKELAITEEARRRGISTLEIYGVWVKRVWGPFYQGWLVTRELKGAHNLWNALQANLKQDARLPLLLRAVAGNVRQMHRKGIYHRDLNLRNILVQWGSGTVQTYIIDFDRAKMFSQQVPATKAQKNLNRLLRSICKLDPSRQFLSQDDWKLFLRFYGEANEG